MQAKAKDLLDWYDRHARTLPWRIGPKAGKAGKRPDPYHVWLSEIMLQQTNVTTVKPYFENFLALWPSLEDLAAADPDDVLKAWAGLGYYSRARNLKACADYVVAEWNGRFPKDVAELKELPGIGDYTAAAISAIAFDKPATIVDGNVERVISRLFMVEEALPKAKKPIRQHAETLTPTKRAGDYAQAIMDLGATICSPKNPACALCPWGEACAARGAGAQERFPIKAKKLAKPTRYGWAFVAVREDGAVLLRKRAETGLLAGMSEVPGTVWQPDKWPGNPYSAAPFQAGWRQDCGIVRHTFTHFHLEVRVMKNNFPMTTSAPKNSWWSQPSEISGEALPSVFKKIVEMACPGSTRKRGEGTVEDG